MMRKLFLTSVALVVVQAVAFAQGENYKKARGTVVTVENTTISIKDSSAPGKVWSFSPAPNCRVTLNDERNMKVSDLQPGDTVLCFYQLNAGTYTASEIRGTRKGQDVEGTIQSINTDNSTFVIKDSNNKSWTLHMSPVAFVGVNDQNNLKLADLRQGDQVQATYFIRDDNRYVTTITGTRKLNN